MKEKFMKVSLKATIFFAGLGLLTVPMAAQQEVSPDHFDEKPAAARPHKPALAARKTAEKSKQNAGSQNTVSKSNNASKSAALTADARSTAR
jgi:hypothetical protein